MRRLMIPLGLALLAALMLVGCGSRQAAPATAALPETIGAWPDNAYTAGLPEPQGTPDYVIDDTAQGRFSVFYQGVDREAWEGWLEQLEQAGYTRRAEASETESENGLFVGRDRTLSVSWSGDVLAIAITSEKS